MTTEDGAPWGPQQPVVGLYGTGVVAVSGADAASFLQGQLSQDIAGLAVGASTPSFLLSPQGKVVAWLRVTRLADESFLLDVVGAESRSVLERLQRFRLRTKVEFEYADWECVTVRGPGAQGIAAAAAVAGEVYALPAAWPGVEGFDLVGRRVAVPSDAELVDRAVVDGLRVMAGVPAMGREATDVTIPAELGQWVIDASVSFTKGCYTGQELVARIDSRGGNVPRPIRGLVLGVDVPSATEAGRAALGDAPLWAADGDAPIGRVTTVGAAVDPGSCLALGVVGRQAPPGALLEVRIADHAPVTARVCELAGDGSSWWDAPEA